MDTPQDNLSIPLFSGLVTDISPGSGRKAKTLSIPLFSGLVTDQAALSDWSGTPCSQSLCFQGWLLTATAFSAASQNALSIPLFSGLVTDKLQDTRIR